MDVGEMFAGIGGFRLGLERANYSHEKKEKLLKIAQSNNGNIGYTARGSINGKAFSVVWANEWDKYAASIYRKNFGEKELIEGDITKVNPKDIPDIDLLCGGFPCQPHSLAGKRKGFSDERGEVFYEIVRIARAKRPKMLLLENVKGLLSSEGGRAFGTVLEELGNIGYWCEWKTLNSKYFGVPQNRERVFIIGHLRDGGTRQVFPISNHLIRIYQDETPTLTSQMGTGGGNVPLVTQALQTDGFLRQGSSFGTDKSQSSRNVRRLTPTECEFLQGFLKNWTKYGLATNGEIVEISDTQRYKCLGNAVTVPVIQAIGELILEALEVAA